MGTEMKQRGTTSMLKHIPFVALAVAGAMISSTAVAEDKKVASDYVIKKDDMKKSDKKKAGIDWRINAGATLNLSDNRSVVGQVDGSTIAFGFKFDAGLDWHDGPHQWRNSLGVAAGVSRTAAVPEFVKSQDQIDAESIYLYHFNDWLGAYARVAWSSQMFRGTDVRGGPTTYKIDYLDGPDGAGTNCDQQTNPDGSVSLIPCNRLNLTDPFRPSRFKESVGIFAQPVTEEPFSLETRLGLGGRQTLAKGQLAVNDTDPEDAVIDVVELDDVLQLGGELAVEIWGTFEDKKIQYRAGAEVMMPFVTNDDDGKSVTELTNILLYANVGVKVVEWASLDYSLRVLREPQLLDAFQVQNQLLLTMGLSAGSAAEAKSE